MTEKTMLEHLEEIGEFIDSAEHAELVDDSVFDVTAACEAYKALETFFKEYYSTQAACIGADKIKATVVG